MLDTLATNPPVNPNDLINALPTKWQAPIALGVVIAMAVGRMIYAIKSKRSFWGVLGAIFGGTNQPKVPGNPNPSQGSRMPYIIILLASASLLTACATYKPAYHLGQPMASWTDSTICVYDNLSADIPQDSLLYYVDQGMILGDKANNVKVYWKSLGTADILNGNVVIEPNICINGSDFCIKGQYWIQVPRNDLYTMIQKGLTFGTPAASVFVQYKNGTLSVTPKICIKTK